MADKQAQVKESSDLAGQRDLRIQKLEELKKLGVNPYPVKSNKEVKNKQILEHFGDYEGKEVTVAGRIMASREHGQLRFMDLEDTSGKVQLYIKKDELNETQLEKEILGWEHLDLLDTGDFIEAQGVVTKTQRGEISILVKSIRILTKAIRPMPTDLEDKEDRYRRRYLDMVLHPEIREMFKRRSQFWQEIRNFLNDNGFIEINIPVLEHTTGGADAKPFETHFDALDENLYLRISHELPLKRLLGAGFEKVYDIGPRFRNEGIDDEHLPEHIAMEWYWAYADYRDGMKFTENMYKHVLMKIYGTLQFKIKGFEINLEDEWKQIKFVDVIKEHFGIDVFEASLEEMNEVIKKQGAEPEDNISRASDRLWKFIRKDIAGPAFLIDVPKFLSPLSKSDPENPKITQRFHPVIAGSELANAFSELNDPQDQLERFLEQHKMRESGDSEAHMLDIDFVEMLEYGMPPAVGFGLSERVFWFFEDITAKEGVPFPQLRHTIDDTTKKIYPQINFEKIEEKYEKKRAKNESSNNKTAVNSKLPTRKEAQELLEKHVEEEYQLLHAKMVATALEKLASEYEPGNEDLWYVTGLLHDLDYFEYPDEHPEKSLEWFKEMGLPDELIHAVEAHAHLINGVEPESTLAKALIATDELSGLLYAYNLMRPKGFDGMKAKKAEKKFKDPSFAAKINREEVRYGIDKLGTDLKTHTQKLIEVFKEMEEFGK
jgi:lysyl-tRNA synthetase class 2